jgi:hypothetical protein
VSAQAVTINKAIRENMKIEERKERRQQMAQYFYPSNIDISNIYTKFQDWLAGSYMEEYLAAQDSASSLQISDLSPPPTGKFC